MSTSEQNYLNGKHVLFIGQVFYDYHTKIISQLEEFGARVTFHENKIFKENGVNGNLVTRIFHPIIAKKKDRYIEEILANTKAEKFDYFFCVGGFSITDKLMQGLRRQNPGVKCILYLWDSLKIWDYSSIIKLFDSAFSFDGDDCLSLNSLHYLPLFYTEEYAKANSSVTDIDLLYVGSVGAVSMDRLEMLSKLAQKAKLLNLEVYFHLYFAPSKGLKSVINKIRMLFVDNTHFLNVIHKNMQKDNSFLKTNTLSRAQISTLLNKAKCVLDIPVKNQSGMTIRTIETLAMGKKVMTTNEAIRNQRFYCPSMISVIGDDFTIDKFFLKTNHKPIDMTYLRLDNWLKTVFEG